jgi:tetratricopeptide (TPR) repeat protein
MHRAAFAFARFSRPAALMIACLTLAPLAAYTAARAAQPVSQAMVIPFSEDDFKAAMARARTRHVPLFVDAWAPWCHTCRSMRAFVFTDPSLARELTHFEWLEINTEKPENADFRMRYPVPALPSILIIDPTTERVTLRWVGGATTTQLLRMLDDALAVSAGARGKTSRDAKSPDAPAEANFARAESLYAAGADSAAANAYEAALAASSAGWRHRSRAVESMLFALQQSGSDRRAAEQALKYLPELAHSSSAGNVVSLGLESAIAIPGPDSSRTATIAALESSARTIAADRSLTMAADDRSAVYIALLDARHDAGDDRGAHEVAEQWSAFLDGEAARAPSADARAVFDSHRLSAYIELGQPERAVPMLESSEKAMPKDYNPPARLAVAYREMKHWPEALAASNRALDKAYGPRMLGMLNVRADIFLGMADSTSARVTLQRAVATAEALPPGQRSDRSIESFRKRLETLH